MTDATLTADEQLRALAALEAIIANDNTALAILEAPGERPLPELLAIYGRHNANRVLLATFGVNASLSHDETRRAVAEINADPMAKVVFSATDTWHRLAAATGSDLAATRAIGSGVLYLIGFFIEESDAAVILQTLRQEVLKGT